MYVVFNNIFLNSEPVLVLLCHKKYGCIIIKCGGLKLKLKIVYHLSHHVILDVKHNVLTAYCWSSSGDGVIHIE